VKQRKIKAEESGLFMEDVFGKQTHSQKWRLQSTIDLYFLNKGKYVNYNPNSEIPEKLMWTSWLFCPIATYPIQS
jgi:hypothetical protein